MVKHPDHKPSLFATAKKLAAWATVGTAILAFFMQGYSIFQKLQENAKRQQSRDDQVLAIKKDVGDMKEGLQQLNQKVDNYLIGPAPPKSPHLTLVPPYYGENP